MRGAVVALLFASLGAAFVIAQTVNPPFYHSLVREDGPVENATSISLFAASALFALAARRHRAETRVRNFGAAFSLALCLAALDEISWGQRILGVDAPEFFIENTDQGEISLHNTLQEWSGVTTKHIVGLGFVIYGVVMPWLMYTGRLTRRGVARYVIFPPLFLSVAIVIGALFMIDMPTGTEEEVGELLLGLCLCLFGAHVARSPQGMIEPARRFSAAS